jgi:hypothetical protein
MKVYIDKDNHDYIEIKKDNDGNVDLSIRTKKDKKTGLVITAKLDLDSLDKIIANLILLKSRIVNEKGF